jgi:hypothetical protein
VPDGPGGAAEYLVSLAFKIHYFNPLEVLSSILILKSCLRIV